MSARDQLLERWGDAAAVEDVISAYRRALDRYGPELRTIVLDVGHGPIKELERLAWQEGRRALWTHVLNVAGGQVPVPRGTACLQLSGPLELGEPMLRDLGAECWFWRPLTAFGWPLEFAFHHGRRSAFEHLCGHAGVDPYTLRRPRREAER